MNKRLTEEERDNLLIAMVRHQQQLVSQLANLATAVHTLGTAVQKVDGVAPDSRPTHDALQHIRALLKPHNDE